MDRKPILIKNDNYYIIKWTGGNKPDKEFIKTKDRKFALMAYKAHNPFAPYYVEDMTDKEVAI